ncbi:hypothetical protein F2Q68_00007140 [Brassica cretica]|uniref:MYB-CC type transcription factor LHEQLE-containing domain-containing protein n=1 Tax=Brassica cretica TaxID=69181 RepID=A0A8S9KS94_BRACR|nr:hypothetical protein F2Q68_00007140 [Brassica cretica]
MDNINFETSNASQGSRLHLHSQSQPPQLFNLQDVNMNHYNQSSPWTSETFSGKFEKGSCSKELSQLDTKTGVQIKEALQLQLDVQRHLHEQLEIQRNLQLRIEEQGKQLKIMIEQQQKTKECLLLKSPNAEASLSLSASDHSPPPFSIQDAEALMLTTYGDTQSQSKIS